MYETRIGYQGQIALWCRPLDDFHSIALHLPGLPNIPTPIAGITEFLVSRGFAVLQPHYPGTHDSNGVFDPYQTYRCVDIWSNAMKSGEIVDLRKGERLPAQKRLTLLSSHSFGTYVGMKALRSGFQVERALFFAPIFGFGRFAKAFGLKTDLAKHAKYIRDAYRETFRPATSDVIEKFYLDFDGDNYPACSNDLTHTNCIAVVGQNDAVVDPDVNRRGTARFFAQHERRFTFAGALVAENADHSVQDMLTPDVGEKLLTWLKSPPSVTACSPY